MVVKEAVRIETENMLEIEHLSVAVCDRDILHDINLGVKASETHVLFGPKGSGKATLLMAIMGSPKYQTKATSPTRRLWAR